MPLAHAKYFAPSSAHRNILCPASVRLNAEIEGKESLPAAEGTVAHHVAEYCMKANIAPYSLLGNWYFYMGHGVVEEDDIEALEHMWAFEVDEEMVAALTGYISHCYRRPGERHVEIRVDISKYCPIPDQFGTSDHIAIDTLSGTIYVDDLKYGKGVKVSPEENWQAISYALGALEWLRVKRPKDYALIHTIVIGIYQPRIDNIDEWITTVEHILELGQYMKQRYAIAFAPNPPFSPSAKACQWCKVVPCKAEAETITDELIEGLDDDTKVTTEAIEDQYTLDIDSAAGIWLQKPWFDNFFRKLHDFLFRKIVDSEPSELLRLGEGRGSRYWKNEVEAGMELTRMGVEELYTQPKIISPAKAEKFLTKKQKEEIKQLIGKKPGSPRLVPMSSEHKDYGNELLAGLDNLDDDLDYLD